MTKAEALEKKLIKDHEKALKVQEKQAREQLKKQKDQEKESKRLERLRKKAAIEQKKIARAFKAEQATLRKTRLFDDVSIKTIKGAATSVKRELPNGAMWMGKECVMFLLNHPDNPDVALLRVDDPVKTSWRNGYWFYDFDNKIQMKFIKEVHKPEHGNASVRWEAFDKYIKEKWEKWNE
jgi:hypothetical protein